jgi:protein-S-isoprenylcysteine O-methyltransferase Ste14
MVMSERMAQIAYGALFTLFVPALLFVWAWRLDMLGLALWPQPVPPAIGAVLLAAGVALMSASMQALWQRGAGLPMNAFPTTKLVTSSTFALFAHPIYCGFVMAVCGMAVLLDSPAGFWIVTPLTALGATALVVGYEGPRTRARLGEREAPPLLGLPPAHDSPASLAQRVCAGSVALAPWAMLHALLSHMPQASDALELRMAWERSLPLPEAALWIYSAAYLFVPAAFLAAQPLAALRRSVISAWLISAIGFLTMFVFPTHSPFAVGAYSEIGAWLAQANRALDAPWLAFPAFHAAWAVLAACALGVNARPFSRGLLATAAAAVCASAVLTGSHAIADVLAGALLGAASWQHRPLWLRAVRLTERAANAWSAISIGPVRIINHALWSGLAGSAGALYVLWLAGGTHAPHVAFIVTFGLLCAGAWGYRLESSNRLARPFGYYGFLLGAAVAIALTALLDARSAALLCAACATAAPCAQAIGRVRCLIQGCCHGAPVNRAYGIRVTDLMSRVCALAELRGVAIHPTPLYSMAANVVTGLVLLRLWTLGWSWSVIAGAYLILSSLARFMEEGYRGEPQTPRRFGLPVYQWLAVAGVLAGMALSMVPGAVVGIAGGLGSPALFMAIGCGALAALLMSVDVPHSSRRFSRLTVTHAPAAVRRDGIRPDPTRTPIARMAVNDAPKG